jgi:RNA polymerase sigma-70 factor (ECF subfamily)
MNQDLERYYDALLIVRYQAGDDTALAELVGRYEATVRQWIVRWLGGQSSAVDDLSQEVWVALVKGLGRLEQPTSFRPWLYQIIRHQVAAYIRRRERKSVPLDAIRDPEDHRSRPLEEPMRPGTLEAAIHALGEPYASMLRMRFWDSLSYQQIADALNIPLGTVRSRLHWARSQLAARLNNEELEA